MVQAKILSREAYPFSWSGLGGGQVGRQAGGSLSWLVSSSPPPPPYIPPSLQMAVIGQQAGSSSNLTELQEVNLDAAHSTKSD